MFYIYNQSNKTMKKLENLNFNHKNGNLVSFNDKIYCISGDYTKKVELYSKINNKWNIVSELNQEQARCIDIAHKSKEKILSNGTRTLNQKREDKEK